MLLFGTIDKPFSPEFIDEEHLYIKKLFSKKVNQHLIELLNYLNTKADNQWQISDIEEIDNSFDPDSKLRLQNKESIYLNYKNYIYDKQLLDERNISTLWNIKTLFILKSTVEQRHKDLNYSLLNFLADKVISDLEVTSEEILLSNRLCEALYINSSEFVSLLENKSTPVISKFLLSKSYDTIEQKDIEKIKNYYDFLNNKGWKYDNDLPIKFLNEYNKVCVKKDIPLIGLKLNIGFPTMLEFPLLGAYEGKFSKMRIIKGQATFEQGPARFYLFFGGILIAHKYEYIDSFNGIVNNITISEIKSLQNKIFFNTGEKYLEVHKKAERNPYAISGLNEDEIFILNSCISLNTTSVLPTEFSYQEQVEIKDEKEVNSMADVKNEDYVSELQKLIGLDEVKQQISTLINFIKIQKLRTQKDLKTTSISLHSVFTGTPGTGKTTVARLYGGILKQLGILKKGHLVEVDRSGLVAGYLGQTAIKVDEVINKALDGILFIDEAYSLTSSTNDSYGEEAVDILLKRMEDNRNRLVVILAGYNTEMEEFINSNPGLKSRFSRYINFSNYSANELHEIFSSLCKEHDYKLSSDADETIKKHFDLVINSNETNFGNGRYVRNIFETIIERHSNRLVNISIPSDEDMVTFTQADVNI